MATLKAKNFKAGEIEKAELTLCVSELLRLNPTQKFKDFRGA